MLKEMMKIFSIAILVMGVICISIIYYNEKQYQDRANRVAIVSMRISEPLNHVDSVGISIGKEFQFYSFEETIDTIIDNIAVDLSMIHPITVRYYTKNRKYRDLIALDSFVNQGLSGVNILELFQDSVTYRYHP